MMGSVNFLSFRLSLTAKLSALNLNRIVITKINCNILSSKAKESKKKIRQFFYDYDFLRQGNIPTKDSQSSQSHN